VAAPPDLNPDYPEDVPMPLRFTSRVVAAAMVLALAACGDTPPSQPESEPANTAVAATPAPAQTPARPAVSAVPPAPGTTLARVEGPGRVNVIANVQGQGFDVVDSVLQNETDLSTLQAYDVDGSPLGRLAAGSFTGECGAADVVADGRRLIVTMLVKTVPAAGIVQATHALQLNAWDARSGAQVWSATPIEPSPEPIACQAYDGNLQSVSTTFDGKWGVLLWPRPQAMLRVAVDLRTGRIHPRADLLGTIGNYVTTGTDETVYSGKPNTVNVTVPGEWQVLGTFRSGADDGTIDLARTGRMARTGLANTGQSGDKTVSTPDGTTVVTVVESGPHRKVDSVNAYRLPSAQPLWTIKTPQYFTDTVHAINASILLIARAPNGAAPDGIEYMAVDVNTGNIVWSQKIVDVSTCMLTSRFVQVRATSQFATLDAATGKQLSYTGDADSCLPPVATGLTGVALSDRAVVQLLNP
jgi:hypothetical protein